MADSEKTAISQYLAKLIEMKKQRAELESKIRRYENAARAVIGLLDNEEEQFQYLEELDSIAPAAGLTEAIRQALRGTWGESMTPMEVRDATGIFLIGHSNPLASVHTVLKRLAKTDTVEQVTKDGKTAYRWVAPQTLSRVMIATPTDVKAALGKGDKK
jgi:hypothetical protein